MNNILFLFILIALAASSSLIDNPVLKNYSGYKIIGTATGLRDNTWLYLENSESMKVIDSAIVINGRFKFTGRIKGSVLRVMIGTKDLSDYKFFWLENDLINFTGEKGKFRTASVTGSKTENDQQRLDSTIKVNGNEKETEIAFINKHPGSMISIFLLSIYSPAWGKDLSTMLYKNIVGDLKNTTYGKNVLDFITLNKDLKIGDKYVDFAQPNIQGKMVKLSGFKGKVVLLEFWASWCSPCREGNPDLVKIYNSYKQKGFEILGVSADDQKKDWRDAVKKDGLTWENVTDFRGDKNKAALIYGVSYYPTNFLIDKTGTIIARDLKGEELNKKLGELLN